MVDTAAIRIARASSANTGRGRGCATRRGGDTGAVIVAMFAESFVCTWVVVEAVVLWCLNRQGDALSTHVEEERRRRMLWRSAQRMLSSLYLLFSVYIF